VIPAVLDESSRGSVAAWRDAKVQPHDCRLAAHRCATRAEVEDVGFHIGHPAQRRRIDGLETDKVRPSLEVDIEGAPPFSTDVVPAPVFGLGELLLDDLAASERRL
jgi:hypothetical protein